MMETEGLLLALGLGLWCAVHVWRYGTPAGWFIDGIALFPIILWAWIYEVPVWLLIPALWACWHHWQSAWAHRRGESWTWRRFSLLPLAVGILWVSGNRIEAALWGFASTAPLGVLHPILLRLAVGRAGEAPMGMAAGINTVVGWATFAFGCLLGGTLAPVVLLMGRSGLVSKAARLLMYRVFANCPFVRMQPNRDCAPEDARVVVMNHESMLDIVAAFVCGGHRILLSKTWVQRTPLMGLAARGLGVRNVDTIDASRLAEGDQALFRPYRGMVVFPEGSRQKTGRPGIYHRGAFALARELDAAVTPLAIVGSRLCMRPGSVIVQPGQIQVVPLEPIADPGGTLGGWGRLTRQCLHQARLSTHKRLLGEGLAKHRHTCYALGLPWRYRRQFTAACKRLPRAFILDSLPDTLESVVITGKDALALAVAVLINEFDGGAQVYIPDVPLAIASHLLPHSTLPSPLPTEPLTQPVVRIDTGAESLPIAASLIIAGPDNLAPKDANGPDGWRCWVPDIDTTSSTAGCLDDSH